MVSTLEYDYSRVVPGIERLGAARALEQPKQAVCMEFTDLFVAIARSAGIPARAVHGYAYTTNSKLQPLSLVSDILHAWPQYYDEARHIWVAIDPTWGSTTRGVDYFNRLDFNHVTFAILGVESDYPYPPGASAEENGKNVDVKFSQNKLDKPQTSFTAGVDNKSPLNSGSTQTVNVAIRNTGMVAYTPQALSTFPSEIFSSAGFSSKVIPPFGTLKIPVKAVTPRYWKPADLSVSVLLDGQTFKTDIKVAPFYLRFIPWMVIITLALSLFAILMLYARSQAHLRS